MKRGNNLKAEGAGPVAPGGRERGAAKFGSPVTAITVVGQMNVRPYLVPIYSCHTPDVALTVAARLRVGERAPEAWWRDTWHNMRTQARGISFIR